MAFKREATCDVCGIQASRALSACGPDSWLFAESPIVNHDNRIIEVLIVNVCSVACADKFFVAGPGDLRKGLKVGDIWPPEGEAKK